MIAAFCSSWQAACDGATLWLVPVSISYERVPEQARLAEELSSAGRNLELFKAGVIGLMRCDAWLALTVKSLVFGLSCKYIPMVNLALLFRWSMKALSGRVRLGKVVMRAGEPVALKPDGDVRAAVLEVWCCRSLHAVHGMLVEMDSFVD